MPTRVAKAVFTSWLRRVRDARQRRGSALEVYHIGLVLKGLGFGV